MDVEGIMSDYQPSQEHADRVNREFSAHREKGDCGCGIRYFLTDDKVDVVTTLCPEAKRILLSLYDSCGMPFGKFFKEEPDGKWTEVDGYED